jgi:hypothetical protein
MSSSIVGMHHKQFLFGHAYSLTDSTTTHALPNPHSRQRERTYVYHILTSLLLQGQLRISRHHFVGEYVPKEWTTLQERKQHEPAKLSLSGQT